uniref:Integrase catalytic domain-containing protein n=1 Tax=Fagus sylvatica TaxID=28930 RepID=A0A2N9F483_FAGSY
MAPGSRGAGAVFVCFSGEDSGQTGDAFGEPRVPRRSRSRYLSNAPGLADQLVASQKDSAREGGFPDVGFRSSWYRRKACAAYFCKVPDSRESELGLVRYGPANRGHRGVFGPLEDIFPIGIPARPGRLCAQAWQRRWENSGIFSTASFRRPVFTPCIEASLGSQDMILQTEAVGMFLTPRVSSIQPLVWSTVWSNLGQTWSTLVKLGRIWSKLSKFWERHPGPHFDGFWAWRTLVGSETARSNLVNPGQTWSTLVELGQTSGDVSWIFFLGLFDVASLRRVSYEEDEELKSLVSRLQASGEGEGHYTLNQGLLFYKDRFCIGKESGMKIKVLALIHDSPLGGHLGYLKSLHRAKKDWFWHGMKKDIKAYIKGCDTCQRLKHETSKPAGLLQPLAIPPRPWHSISMDFVEGLPTSSKQNVAVLFVQYVFKLHGLPSSIMSDRDTVFTSLFWEELFRRQGVDLAMSFSYHSQFDGQTEVVNKSLEHYLRAFAADKPSLWVEWLPLAEYWFNTNYQTSTKLSPFEAMYSYLPYRLIEFMSGLTRVAAVEDLLEHRQKSMHKKLGKLSPKFYGPYKVIQRVGMVAYKLELAEGACVHPVFHVPFLKAKLGKTITHISRLPPTDALGHLAP